MSRTALEPPNDAAARLVVVDALRGVAALLVVLHHLPTTYGLWVWLKPLQSIGHYGVGLFLVLSGFSIHYRWAATRGRGASFDYKTFWARRFWRLYPTYLAALGVAAGLSVIAGGHGNVAWAFGGTVPPWVVVLTYLVLAPTNIVDVPWPGHVAWSLGLEVQLYLAYAVVVRYWRNFDPWRLVLAAFVVSVAWRLGSEFITTSVPQGRFLPDQTATAESRFFFMQLPARAFEWFLGVLAAEIYCRRLPVPALARSLPVALIAIFAGAVIFRFPIGGTSLGGNGFFASDLILDQLFGIGFFVLLLSAVEGASPWLQTSRTVTWLARIGLFSYSVYLVHAPVLHALEHLLPTSGLEGAIGLPVLFVASIAASYCFHLAVERRFIEISARQGRRRVVEPELHA